MKEEHLEIIIIIIAWRLLDRTIPIDSNWSQLKVIVSLATTKQF